MEYLSLFFYSLTKLSHAMSPYILFGLLFAGILHVLVPKSIISKHLGEENLFSVIKSTLFGIPLPVCSCGVIPLAASMKKSGASKGATLSFLISTPITGVDSILATYGMFGWVFTLYRVFSSILIATLAGILCNIFDKEQAKASFTSTPQTTQIPQQSCLVNPREKSSKFSLQEVFTYAFGTLLKDIAKPLLYGLLLGALITTAIPQNLSEILMQNLWISYLLSLAIALPLYVCATASLPIAAALILAGVSPGAAFVFLSAGPATNTVTMGVVKTMLGGKSLGIYLGSIIFGSVVFGIGLDFIFTRSALDIHALIRMDEEASLFAILCSGVLWILLLYYSFKPYLIKVS